MGSCFSDHIGERFQSLGLSVLTNPFGVIFHPIPLLEILLNALQCEFNYSSENLFEFENRFYSLAHHGAYSDESEEKLLHSLNQDLNKLRSGLSDSKTLCLTLGTSWGYENEGVIAANCHKLPQSFFKKTLTSSVFIQNKLKEVIDALQRLNSSMNIILTVSPVRHVKDGLIENNRSKAQLLSAVHNICDSEKSIFYFPSYELIMDDLRDYRFFKEDLIHPTDVAVDYVQEAFLKFGFDEESILAVKDLQKFQAFYRHRVSNENSQAHKLKIEEKRSELERKYPRLRS